MSSVSAALYKNISGVVLPGHRTLLGSLEGTLEPAKDGCFLIAVHSGF